MTNGSLKKKGVRTDEHYAVKWDAMLAVSVALLTAFVGALLPLVLVPEAFRWGAVAGFGVLVVVALALTGWSVAKRERIRRTKLAKRDHEEEERRTRGTLFYVRMLDSRMSDIHLDDLRQAVEGQPDVRATISSIFPHHYLPNRTIENVTLGALDVVEQVQETARSVQSEMNSDDILTAFSLAPNTLWPVGMAMGSQLLIFDNTTMVEVAGDLQHWELDPLSQQHSQQQFAPQPPVSWKPPTSQGHGGSPVLFRLEYGGPATTPDPWEAYPYEARLHLTGEGGEVCQHTLSKAEHGNANQIYVEPNALVSYAAQAIFSVLESSNSPVVLISRMPKSMQLPLGVHLAQKLESTRAPRDTQDPWERLITVQLSTSRSGTPPPPVVTRVHPAQPPIGDMIDIVARLDHRS